ncbi:hypothetical protein ACOSP7_020379 [Xanthoceras sorbifolium]
MENSVMERVLSGGPKPDSEDEEAMTWAAMEEGENDHGSCKIVQKEVDVKKMDANDKKLFIERNLKVAEQDNDKFLKKFRDRIDKVGIQLPTVEVRFEQLKVEAYCYVGTRALPTLINTAKNIAESAVSLCGIRLAKRTKLTILKDVSGIIKPSRMTLLLGPPSSGKTTLLLALAGMLDTSLKVGGQVTYNGYRLDEFVPQKTSAYVSQNDVHLGDLTVKETMDYSARFQGVGFRYDLLNELAKREKDAGIRPEADVDIFMKATAVEGAESSLITDYTLKLLGLDICKDTVVGDEMRRGISGGQKKRVTTGEMIVGPTKTLFMDEISTGLDSSTTYQIVKCMQQIAHLTEATILMSLLQPDPETFDLFDDIILLSEGRIVYQGPREHVLEFFESFGFKCPERKGIADFLQEVTSRKDQEQYWANMNKPYQYISVTDFASRFKAFHVGLQLENELSIPYDKTKSHKAALIFKKYTIPKMQLLKTSMDREKLLIKRTAPVYIFKTIQIIIVAVIASTVYLRTTLSVTYDDGALYIGAMIFAMIVNMFNGFAELSIAIMRLPVFYKHRDLQFYPAWAFTIPNFLLRVPMSVLESIVWTVVTYFTIGYAPGASRFFKHLLVIFFIQQMAAGLFRLMAGVCRTMIIAHTGGALSLLILFLLGGFILPKGQIPVWWSWGHWISPLSYGFNALTNNEMLSPRWMNKASTGNVTSLGMAVLEQFDVDPKEYWYWIGVAALLGFTILFNVLFTFSLMYLNPLGKPQAIISEEEANEQSNQGETKRNAESKTMISTGANNTREMEKMEVCSQSNAAGVTEDRLQLLRKVTGAFRPGVLTALMGAIPGVPKIREKQNPAAWMLEASSEAAEVRLGIDFAERYKSSSLYKQIEALVKGLSTPPEGATDLYFPTQYSQSTWEQFKSCLWKQWWTYWRSPDYNLVRFCFTFVAALVLGTIFWQVGTKRENSTDLSMIIGAMYVAVLFVGINNCSTVQPVVAVERTVFYRERAAGMYSALPYALAQVIVEIPYIFVQTTYYSLIVYAMVSFEWVLSKFIWFFFITFFSFLYFTYYGMMTVSITPNHQAAAIFASAFYALFTLFSGFFIPKPRIPKWWTWYYYICPVAWTVYGLIVTQYGDIEDTIKVPGILPDPSIKWYVQNHFGYDLNFMGPTTVILVAFAAFFALMFAVCIKTLNFQQR